MYKILVNNFLFGQSGVYNVIFKKDSGNIADLSEQNIFFNKFDLEPSWKQVHL